MTLYFQIEFRTRRSKPPACFPAPPLPPPSAPPPHPPFGFPGLWAWSFQSFILLKFLLYLLVFLKSFRMVSMPFVSLHCSYHLGVDCVLMGNWSRGVGSHVFLVSLQCVHRKILDRLVLRQVPLSLVHKVMMCLCQKFLYISFISWKKVYFYVFRSMNGTL